MYKCIERRVLLAIFAAAGLVASASGQSLWPDQTGDRAISVEFLKPEFEGDDDTDFLTSTTFLSGRFPITPAITGEAELPFSRYGISNDVVERSESAIGNPYIGVRIRSHNLVSRIGLRIPIASDDNPNALTAGRLTDYDRFEAFLPDVLAVNGSVTGPFRLSDNVTLNPGGGLVLLVSTQDGGGDDTEVYAQYFLIGEFTGGKFTLKSGFTGRAILSESDLDFGDRSTHQFGLGGTLSTGTVRPGLHLRIPLDEGLKDNVDYVVGLNVTIVLP